MYLPSVRMAVDFALAWTKHHGIGIVNQQKLQLVDVHPIAIIFARSVLGVESRHMMP